MKTTKERIVTLIASHLMREESHVTEEKSIMDDLGGDSLDTVELVMAVETEFNIEIEDPDAEKLLTVGDFIKHVETATGQVSA